MLMSMNDLSHIVDQNDVGLLQKVPGVGKKTAERLLVELKNQLGDLLKLQSHGVSDQNKVTGSVSRHGPSYFILIGYSMALQFQQIT